MSTSWSTASRAVAAISLLAGTEPEAGVSASPAGLLGQVGVAVGQYRTRSRTTPAKSGHSKAGVTDD